MSSYWIAAAADVTNPNDFGGLPYYFYSAGNEKGLFDGGFAFSNNTLSLKLARCMWNLRMYVKHKKLGGFQYSEEFLQRLWRTDKNSNQNVNVINIFQLYPQAEMLKATKKYFYLDQTLTEVFEYYNTNKKMSEIWCREVIEKEKQQYHQAEKIIFRSHWAANRAIKTYGLPKDKVQVVLPGANIPQAALKTFDLAGMKKFARTGPLRMIFIGKDWQRKGLDRLLGAMHIAKTKGANLHLTVIGVTERDLPQDTASGLDVNWIGYYDKNKYAKQFVELVSGFDIGVLLSRSEAGGVSLREFGRLGLPVVAPNTGGSPEFAMSDHAVLIDPEMTNEEISNIIIDLEKDRDLLERKKRLSWEQRHLFDWNYSIERILDIL